MTTAILFPGMGPAQPADSVKFLLTDPTARGLIAAADKTLGYSLIDRHLSAPGDYTPAAQILFMVHCLAVARSADLRPDFVTGPSFGARAAAAYTGVLTFDEAVWMTARLAEVVAEYFTLAHKDIVTHSVVRVTEDVLAELDDWYEISCQVDTDFFMVSLRESRLPWLIKRLASVGGLSLYTMRPPMHVSVLGELRARVDSEVFGQLGWRDPGVPVVADQDGSLRCSGVEVRAMMLDGFVRAVRWPLVVESLLRNGVGTLFVSGVDGMFSRTRCSTRSFSVVRVR